jgi:pimeloyl-ACP methyl ester carboxylesterase
MTDPQALFMEDFGSGSAVVLIHGVPTSPGDFAPLTGALVHRHRVLVPHLPGYGRTPADPGPYSLYRTMARLEQTLASCGVVQADVVAISGGAYKALALALGHRLRITRLALLSPAIGFDPAVAKAHRDMVAAVRSGALDLRALWLGRMASPGLRERDPAGAAQVLAWLDAAPLTLICDELLAQVAAVDLRPRVADLHCPVLVCSGTADNAVPPAWSEAVAASARRGVLARVEGAGHALLVEAPARTVRLIADFLELS